MTHGHFFAKVQRSRTGKRSREKEQDKEKSTPICFKENRKENVENRVLAGLSRSRISERGGSSDLFYKGSAS